MQKAAEYVSDDEIDKAFQFGVPGEYLRARTIYEFFTGKVGATTVVKRTEQVLAHHKQVYVPILVRNHWLLAIVKKGGGQFTITLYDSAPSQEVFRDARHALTLILRNVDVQRAVSPRQVPRSNECGCVVIS